MRDADTAKKIIFALLLLVIVAALLIVMSGSDLTQLRSYHQQLAEWVKAYPLLSGAALFVAYTLLTAFSVPAATLLALLAGAFFGLLTGTIIISFASTLGATLAMLSSRYLLRDMLSTRYRKQMDAINRGIAREGAYYLFALRLTPLFPFFLINLLMGLTRIPLATYWWVSQLGMLPGTLLYINAGRTLAHLNSVKEVFSLPVIGAFFLLGIFPLLAKKILNYIRH